MDVSALVDAGTACTLTVGETCFLADDRGTLTGTVKAIRKAESIPGDYFVDITDAHLRTQEGDESQTVPAVRPFWQESEDGQA